MFAAHDVVHMSKRGRDMCKKCPTHGEPYIMFSAPKHRMQCINCFRESSVEARLLCTDIDTAYTAAARKLDRGVIGIRELQSSVRDGVVLFKALLDELRTNADLEKASINTMADTLQESLRRTHEAMLREVDVQYESKDKLFRSQLSSLGSLLPIIQVHLAMCTTFAATASKHDFLDVVFLLMERLAAIAHLSHPLRPGQSSQIRSNYRQEFARSLELMSSSSKTRQPVTAPAPCPDKPPPEGQLARTPLSTLEAFTFRAPAAPAAPAKLKLADLEGPFADHCRAHEISFRELSTKFSRLKEEAQELHRDVTHRRVVARRSRVDDIVRESAALEEDVRRYAEELDDVKTAFDATWDELIQRIYAEQELLQTQMNDVANLRDENKRLTIIAQQLEPYIRSISSIMERISPRLQVPASQMLSSSQICLLGTRDPSSALVQQMIGQMAACSRSDRTEGRGCGDGASRGAALEDGPSSKASSAPETPQPQLLPDGVPLPPEPPHVRRGGEHGKEEDQQDYSARQAYGDLAADQLIPCPATPPPPPQRKLPHSREGPTSSTSSLMSLEGSSCNDVFEKSSRGDGPEAARVEKVWQRRRRGSEGSGGPTKLVAATILSKICRQHSEGSSGVRQAHRSLSDERKSSQSSKRDLADHLLARAVASFDASALPERPKSACENSNVTTREDYPADARSRARERGKDNGFQEGEEGTRRPHTRPNSGDREPVNKVNTLPVIKASQPLRLKQNNQKYRVLNDNVYAIATVARRPPVKRENIYENVICFKPKNVGWTMPTRSGFRKQNSMSVLPLMLAEEHKNFGNDSMNERRETVRKADSFEGHEEAVRTLVAQVHKNRTSRLKDVKY
ncbi:RING finger protein 207 isoform X2 [Hyalella azteca]|nr:RING finger protein 207 isoform X2 [Hyalella azteca]